MILVIEIVFLIAGLYALFAGKMPSWIVGKGYKAEGSTVRLIGFLMAALLPGMLCGGFVIGLFATNSNPTGLAMGFEIVSVILAAIVLTVVIRRIRTPDLPPASTELPPPRPEM
jgi:hypothetical protein